MKVFELALARIGNSRGIRLPADLIRRHGFEGGILVEETENAIVLKSKVAPSKKLSWEETAREMLKQTEDWSNWDTTLSDGLEDIPWDDPTPAPASVRARQTPAKPAQKLARKPRPSTP